MARKSGDTGTIVINTEIQGYAEELLPIAHQLQYYYDKQSELFEVFSSYRGSAKAEINEYAQSQLEQLHMFIRGYQTLASDLVSLIEAFIMADEQRATQFSNTLVSKTGSSVIQHFEDKANPAPTVNRNQGMIQ